MAKRLLPPSGRSSRTTRRAPAKPALTKAQAGDRHDLYQRAVQCVEAEIDFVDAEFKRLRKRTAVRLREDFCGTGNTSCEWVRRRRTNYAVGVDLDPEPLAWGQANNASKLSPAQRARLRLEQGNVLDDHSRTLGRFDAVLAMNFSYWCFRERAALAHYFRRAYESLADDGVFFLDFYGGPDAVRELKERRPIGRKGAKNSYTYIWDQAEYDPISSNCTCYIHFAFPDGSRIRRAFSYHWRVWTIPELRELLHEAGFARTTVYWEGDDGKGSGNGEFTPAERGEACASYICYISAER